MKPKQGS